MASGSFNKKNNSGSDYAAELRRLREKGPERLYLLWGTEDYLRLCFGKEIRTVCLPNGDDGFCYRRLDGPQLDPAELSQAVDAPPFLSERTLVELKAVDINKISDDGTLVRILSDIPSWCTVVFELESGYEPDGRLKFVKQLKELARPVSFSVQAQSNLIHWIKRRFAACGKRIELDAIQRLLFLSGEYMSGLIPEIEKIANGTRSEQITAADVDRIATRIPDAVVFDITDAVSRGEYANAVAILQELLQDRDNEPIAMLALLGYHFRRQYAAALAQEKGLGARALVEAGLVKTDYQARNYMSSVRPGERQALARAVELCAVTDYRMKSSSSVTPEDQLREALLTICLLRKEAALSGVRGRTDRL